MGLLEAGAKVKSDPEGAVPVKKEDSGAGVSKMLGEEGALPSGSQGPMLGHVPGFGSCPVVHHPPMPQRAPPPPPVSIATPPNMNAPEEFALL